MTIDEAKTKICPFTLYVEKYKDPIKTHNISYETKGSNCICDKCMAWKWYDTHENIQTNGYCQRLDPITI